MKRFLAVCAVMGLTACGAAVSDLQPETAGSTTSQPLTTAATEPMVGNSSTSSVATATSMPTTTLAPPTTRETVESSVVLEADGLGLVNFGDSFDEVMGKLEAVLGPPSFAEDTAPDSPSRTEFVAGWGQRGLSIGFSTYPVFRDDGKLHFTRWGTYWETGTPPVTPLKTAAGVGLGSTLREIENVYGDRFWIGNDECAPPGIIVPEGDVSGGSLDENGHPRWILVGFDRPGQRDAEDGSRYFEDPDSTRVAGMSAGASDGC